MPAGGHRTRLRAERGANRAAIVAAAETALRQRPFRDLSVEDLMQQAGLARTQFYRHFDDLSDLVLQVCASVFEELLGSYEDAVDVVEITDANLRQAIGRGVDAFVAHGPLVRALLEAAAHDAAVDEAVTAAQARFVALTERLARRAAAEGALLGDPAEAARWLHGANVAYLADAFGGVPRVAPEVAGDTVTRAWLAVLGRPAQA